MTTHIPAPTETRNHDSSDLSP